MAIANKYEYLCKLIEFRKIIIKYWKTNSFKNTYEIHKITGLFSLCCDCDLHKHTRPEVGML